jgi:tetratricopeptide (TPR) repeat protein
MYSSACEKSSRDTLRYFEQVRSFFLQALGGTPGKMTPLRIIAFGSKKEYEPYRINEFADGYYQSTSVRDYIVLSHTGSDAYPMVVHEYVHLLVTHSSLELPPWLNEGLAELYSTLKPTGNKMVVVTLIPGRHQALLRDKWVPLATILAADQNSPYYNEKNQAGSLYNEGWALTHMLLLSPEYRPKFPQLVDAINRKTPSQEALANIYGKPLSAIEKELQAYLRGDRFLAAVFPVALDKSVEDANSETPPVFDVKMLLAELGDRPGNEPATQKALEELIQQAPDRPEPYTARGYLLWRKEGIGPAKKDFQKAFQLGDRNPKLLWDYGRMAENGDATRAITELLAVEPGRVDARIELAGLQMNAREPSKALETLAPVRRINETDAVHLFRIMAFAHAQTKNLDEAEKAATRWKEVAKTDEEKQEADRFLSSVRNARNPRQPVAVTTLVDKTNASDSRAPVRREAANDSHGPKEQTFAEPPSISGTFVELDCKGSQARFVIETVQGKRTLLIQDPTKVTVVSKAGGSVELTCGVQKTRLPVHVTYDELAVRMTGVDGIVQIIQFD